MNSYSSHRKLRGCVLWFAVVVTIGCVAMVICCVRGFMGGEKQDEISVPLIQETPRMDEPLTLPEPFWPEENEDSKDGDRVT